MCKCVGGREVRCVQVYMWGDDMRKLMYDTLCVHVESVCDTHTHSPAHTVSIICIS